MAGKNGRRTAARAAGQAKSAAAEAQFTATLAGLEVALRAQARRYPEFAARLRERDLVAQIRLAGRARGRAYTIRGGKVRSRSGLHPAPDLTMTFDSAEVAVRVMKPGRDYLEFIDALKNFQMSVEGPDDLAVWFSETLQMMLTAGLEYGVDAGGGVRRFTSNTNGGPGVRVRPGRAHPAHHAHRVRRGRRRSRGRSRRAATASPRRARRPSARTRSPGRASSTRPTACSTP